MDEMNDRQRELQSLLKTHHFLTIAELSKQLFASEATIRRDLARLEQMNLVMRTHGGARIYSVSDDLPLTLFNKTGLEAKREIAAQAARLVHDKAVLFLDATSTTLTLLDYIHKIDGLTVFTNGLETAQRAADYGIETYLLGGKIRAISRCCYGSFAEKLLGEVYFDIMFFSAPALSNDGELTHYSPDQIPLIQCVLRRARRRYLLCIRGKVGRVCNYRICNVSDLTGVIHDHSHSDS